jgi:hypothetical protein
MTELSLSLTIRELRVLVAALQWSSEFDDFLWHPDKKEVPKRKRAFKNLLRKLGKVIGALAAEEKKP